MSQNYMCHSSRCARIPDNEGEPYCYVCSVARTEAKAEGRAEGAAEEREAIAQRADELIRFFRSYPGHSSREKELAPEALERFATWVRARGQTKKEGEK